MLLHKCSVSLSLAPALLLLVALALYQQLYLVGYFLKSDVDKHFELITKHHDFEVVMLARGDMKYMCLDSNSIAVLC